MRQVPIPARLRGNVEHAWYVDSPCAAGLELKAPSDRAHLAGTLHEVLREPTLPDPGLDAAAAQLAAGTAVHQLARNRGWSHATLTRRSTAAVGVRRKQYQRSRGSIG